MHHQSATRACDSEYNPNLIPYSLHTQRRAQPGEVLYSDNRQRRYDQEAQGHARSSPGGEPRSSLGAFPYTLYGMEIIYYQQAGSWYP